MVERPSSFPLEFDDDVHFDETTLDGRKQPLDAVVLVEVQRQKQTTFKREKRDDPQADGVKSECHIFSRLT